MVQGLENKAQPFTLRRAIPADATECGRVCFEAFSTLNQRHGFPCDFPSPEAATGLISSVLSAGSVHSIIAESQGRILGSNFVWFDGPIAGVGPITVDPAAQNASVGRRLMEEALAEARRRDSAGVRLVQAAFHNRSLSLYTKLGFDVREPLACMQGPPIRQAIAGHEVRAATEEDVPACNTVCLQVHGHQRANQLMGAIKQKTALVVHHDGRLTGYATGVAFFEHSVALTNTDLIALIAAAPQFGGPGFLLPSRNSAVFRWCLSHGLRVVQPMTLMAMGLYNDPAGAFLPSILY